MHRISIALLIIGLVGCKARNPEYSGKKVLEFAIESKVGSLDPIRAASSYDHWAAAPVYESLFQYNYLARPSRLEPNLLAKMPTISEDGLTYRFELKPGTLFHDDPCFPGGSGRELIAEDVIFSIKRMANLKLRPKGWWIYNDRIAGFDTYKDRQRNRPIGAPFNYDEPVEGLRITGRYTFELKLKRAYPQLLSVLAMPYTSVVARARRLKRTAMSSINLPSVRVPLSSKSGRRVLSLFTHVILNTEMNSTLVLRRQNWAMKRQASSRMPADAFHSLMSLSYTSSKHRNPGG